MAGRDSPHMAGPKTTEQTLIEMGAKVKQGQLVDGMGRRIVFQTDFIPGTVKDREDMLRSRLHPQVEPGAIGIHYKTERGV